MFWFLYFVLFLVVVGLHALIYVVVQSGIKESKKAAPERTVARQESPFKDFLAYQEAGRASALKTA
jgi:hypothetical protein